MAEKKQRDEISELTRLTRLRNQMLAALALQREVVIAAERVVRLSNPGTPERLLTIQAVAQQASVPASLITDAIIEARKRKWQKSLRASRARP